jgi:adenine-specific DNA methylase
MRYIGNKTKLLPFIGDLLDRYRIPPGRALDAFAGTAAVGAFLKARGNSVVGCDLMTFSYVFQRAYVVADAYPALAGLAGDPDLRAARNTPDFAARVDRRVAHRIEVAASAAAVGAPTSETRPLDEVLVFLDRYLDPLTSFVSRNFAAPLTPSTPADGAAKRRHHNRPPRSHHHAGNGTRPEGSSEVARDGRLSGSPSSPRMYFTLERARQIDAIRHRLHEWQIAGAITDDEYYLLLASLIEAADAVANTAGIYAAYIKQWQSNALRKLRLRLPLIVPSRPGRPHRRQTPGPCVAHQGDISSIALGLGHFDLLYLDPPYNNRQYSAYYHIPELIARGWFGEPPVLRGKTGLLPDADKKSAWSSRTLCVGALERLMATVAADHVVLSYNSEGIIPDAEIERVFRAEGRSGTFARISRQYPRYRSDRPSAGRRYKGQVVRENLYYVRVGSRRRTHA